MRFIVTGKRVITLALLEAELKKMNPSYSIIDIAAGPRVAGSLMLGRELYGEIEINAAGDSLFEREIEEFSEGLPSEKSNRCIQYFCRQPILS